MNSISKVEYRMHNNCTHIEFLDKQINEVKELISYHIAGHSDLHDIK